MGKGGCDVEYCKTTKIALDLYYSCSSVNIHRLPLCAIDPVPCLYHCIHFVLNEKLCKLPFRYNNAKLLLYNSQFICVLNINTLDSPTLYMMSTKIYQTKICHCLLCLLSPDMCLYGVQSVFRIY